jgi:hypothetical protein
VDRETVVRVAKLQFATKKRVGVVPEAALCDRHWGVEDLGSESLRDKLAEVSRVRESCLDGRLQGRGGDRAGRQAGGGGPGRRGWRDETGDDNSDESELVEGS